MLTTLGVVGALCGCDPPADAGSMDADASAMDAGADSGASEADAGVDAGSDAGVDAGSDAGVDAGSDSGSDVADAGGSDSGMNAGSDSGVDGGPDVRPDGGSDAGAADAGPCELSGACPHGWSCTSDTDCEGGYCSSNGCAPIGWIVAPAATFTMGAPASERGFHTGRENGQHTVTLTRSLLVERTTVTQAEWASLMGGTTPSMFTTCGLECPVVNVTWFEMLEYANALSRQQGLPECYTLQNCVGTVGAGCSAGLDHCNGYHCDLGPLATLDLDCRGYRLPTESEWEYFARAGSDAPFPTADGTYTNWSPDEFDPQMDAAAWFIDNSAVTYAPNHDCSIWWPTAGPCGPHPVGQKLPNAWGLYDISGNVYERVWDWAGDYPAPGSSVTDPTGPLTGSQKRMRGGSFNLWGQYMRIAYRTGPIPAASYYNIGFRLVRSLP